MKDLSSELFFKTSRSSGKGGQNVNKVETSVTVLWNVNESLLFDSDQKERILSKLKNRINSEGILQITVSDSRTQLQNKKIAITRISELVLDSLKVNPPRKATRPSKAKIEKRLDDKKRRSEKKENRNFRF